MGATKSSAEFRAALHIFVDPSTPQALLAAGIDVALYVSLVTVAVIADPPWIRALAAVGAGIAISGLFVLGHDAAHNNLTQFPSLNRGLAYVLLLPALHNYTLWRLQHNRLHHRHPNVQHQNSWSPLSPDEFRALPKWRQYLERVYRSGVGFWIYYLVHRWWRDKFIPSPTSLRGYGPAVRRNAWRDFRIMLGGGGLFVTALILLAHFCGNGSPLEAFVYGWLLPYLVWNHMMGQTVYFQHTHPKVPWFRHTEMIGELGSQADLSICLKQPLWWDHASHYIANHGAHHINPLIPHYRLRAAQRKLVELVGPSAIVEPWSFSLAFDVLKKCKLYDYEQNRWTDFAGHPTTPRLA